MTKTPEAYLARVWPVWFQGLREAAGTLGVGLLLPSRTGRPKFPCNSLFFFFCLCDPVWCLCVCLAVFL